ncbi:magnesium transporter CorA family protein, partial [Ascoidea rubescens DSM 1968]
WWLDCVCPTDLETRYLSKSFGIHPLTSEDIRMQESREKVELFKNYYFISYHTFENDNESQDYLEPINFYMVVFQNGIITFHFSKVLHSINVRRRIRQLKDYMRIKSDWICYALIDDITDSFVPIINSIEYEADAIEDSVFILREMDFSKMLQTIGEARRKVMILMRLLSGKADVIKIDKIKPGADIALYLGDIQDHIITMFSNLISYEKIFSRSHSNYLAQLQVESFNSNNKVTEMLSKVTLIGTLLVPLNLVTGLFGMNVNVPGSDITNNYYWFIGIVLFLFFIITVGLIVS